MAKHGLTTIKIGGADRPVSFNMNALAEFERLTGVGLGDLEDAFSSIKASHIRALVYSSIKEGQRLSGGLADIEIEEVGSWLTVESMEAVMSEFNKAITPASGEGEDKPAKAGNP